MTFSYYLSKLIKWIQLPAVKNSNIHPSAKIAPASHIVNSTLGKYTFIGSHCTVIDTEVGNFCSIADHVIIGGSAHPIEWVSTSPVFHKGRNILKKNFSEHPFHTTQKTYIGHDVWLGNNCLIKSGITIGTGAVIGMGSVVTKDIPPYEVWAGNPAKKIRKRFDNLTVEKLLESQWWQWEDEMIQRNAHLMHDTINFLKHFEDKEKNVQQ